MAPFFLSFGSNFFAESTIQILTHADLVIKIILAFDILLSFRRAYLRKETGLQVTCQKKIAIRYLKFFFWIDSASCFPFFLFTDNKYLNLLSLLKVFRLYRVNRIIMYLGFSERWRSRIRIVQLVASLVMIVHWITCFFYVVSQATWE